MSLCYDEYQRLTTDTTTVLTDSNIRPHMLEMLSYCKHRVIGCEAWITDDVIARRLGNVPSLDLIITDPSYKLTSTEHFDNIMRCPRLITSVYMMEHGIPRIKELKGMFPIHCVPDRIMHNKFLIIDNVLIYGSYNLTNQATRNFESVIVTSNTNLINTFKDLFYSIKQQATRTIHGTDDFHFILPFYTVGDEYVQFFDVDGDEYKGNSYWIRAIRKLISEGHDPKWLSANEIKTMYEVIIDIETEKIHDHTETTEHISDDEMFDYII